MMENQSLIINKLTRIRSMGIQTSLDDFGTGYSSLLYLKNLPIDKLKIDKHFVQELFYNKNNLSIIRTVIELAGNLNKKVIAEGVETEEQFAKLSELGCDELQGFYIGRPVPDFEAESFILSYTPAGHNQESPSV
jgi:EAL domain-containing protein (putative c-di-GMP-specific phosphodiesterase class I)